MKVLGIILGSLILTGVITFFVAQWKFERHWLRLRSSWLAPAAASAAQEAFVQKKDLERLPRSIQLWLTRSGVVGKAPIRTVTLQQRGQMRMKPEDKNWAQSQSEQVISAERMGFIWKVRMSMMGLPILGRDVFENGMGSMWIGLGGLIPVAHVEAHPKVNQSALQRFMGEIIWIPSLALSNKVIWKEVDPHTAEMSMEVNGTSAKCRFFFTPEGDLQKFVAIRWKDIHDPEPLEWTATVLAYREFAGIRIPATLEATWNLPTGPFTWFKFEITDYAIH
jgi:hypothetical protein